MIWECCGDLRDTNNQDTIREQRGETTDCEGGTYFTHWVVICQAFAPNYSDLISVLLMRKLTLSGSPLHGLPGPGASC